MAMGVAIAFAPTTNYSRFSVVIDAAIVASAIVVCLPMLLALLSSGL